jgi:hypothetical protein
LGIYLAKQNHVPEKAIVWSVTVYSEKLSCQCNLSAAIGLSLTFVVELVIKLIIWLAIIT